MLSSCWFLEHGFSIQTHRKPSLTFWYECVTFSFTRQTSFRWFKHFAMARFNFYANFIQGHTSFVLAHVGKKFLCSNFITIMTKDLAPSTFRMGNIELEKVKNIFIQKILNPSYSNVWYWYTVELLPPFSCTIKVDHIQKKYAVTNADSNLSI